jgi:hypothetical protein
MELYIKTLGDPNFNPKGVDVENEVAQLLIQLETIIFTNRGDVLGDSNFGANLEKMIYSFNLNEFEIKRAVEDQIEMYCSLARKYNTKVDVQFSRGEVRDMAQLNITVDSKYLIGVNIN